MTLFFMAVFPVPTSNSFCRSTRFPDPPCRPWRGPCAFVRSVILSLREGIGPFRKAVLSVLSVILLFGAVLLTAARITVSHLMALFPAVLFVFYGIPGAPRAVEKRGRDPRGHPCGHRRCLSCPRRRDPASRNMDRPFGMAADGALSSSCFLPWNGDHLRRPRACASCWPSSAGSLS